MMAATIGALMDIVISNNNELISRVRGEIQQY